MREYKKGIFIFRRDLRLDYNTGFAEALQKCDTIMPIFIFTPQQVSKNTYKSEKSIYFMIESLSDLQEQIKSHSNSGGLFTFYGENEKIVEGLIQQYNPDVIMFNKDYTPFSKKRDASIEKICNKYGIKVDSFHDVCLFPPGTITTDTGNVYQKYTPFYNKCLKNLDLIDRKNRVRYHTGWCLEKTKVRNTTTLSNITKILLKNTQKGIFQGGRSNGLKIVSNLRKFDNYGDCRNQLNYETTHLSAYLKYGCVSVVEVFNKLIGIDGKNNDLIRQLIWRDFYIHILDAFPRVLQGKSLKPQYDAIQWENKTSWFNAWKKGNTGFPIIDACMRQLNHTGFMHNRGRLIVASFLIKTLLVDWKKGEKYFAQNLIDYDPAANNGNWQWVAGTGADSQPYFRIFNPWAQGERYDVDATYIKKWCPELKDVPSNHIHQWNKYHSQYRTISYPKPIVDYSEMREKALALYKKYL